MRDLITGILSGACSLQERWKAPGTLPESCEQAVVMVETRGAGGCVQQHPSPRQETPSPHRHPSAQNPPKYQTISFSARSSLKMLNDKILVQTCSVEKPIAVNCVFPPLCATSEEIKWNCSNWKLVPCTLTSIHNSVSLAGSTVKWI